MKSTNFTHSGPRTSLVFAALVAVPALFAPFANAEDTSISAGIGGGNGACGSFEPNASFRYDRDSDDTPMHFNMDVSVNGGCTGQFTTIDASLAKRYTISDNFFGYVSAGYDIRTLTVEFASDDPNFKRFRGFATETTTAVAGVGYDFGDNRSFRIGYNAVKNLDNMNKEITPLQATLTWGFGNGLEINADTNTVAHTLSLAFERGNAVFVASMTKGASGLKNDAADWAAENGYEIAGTPDPIYSFGIQWSF